MRRGQKIDGNRVPFADWPQSDQAAWNAAKLPRDPFNAKVGFASRWKPTTQHLIEEGYGHWLGWLDRTGELDPDSDPASRATRPRVEAYLAMLGAAQLAPYTIASRVNQLGNALRAIASNHDWAWMLRGSYRLHSSAPPTRDRAECLRPVEDVLALGTDLMHAATHDRFRTDRERATLFRDGLMIALLCHRPLRCANFHDIAIGDQLQRRGSEWWLGIHASETKGGAPINCTWPAALASKLDRYIEVHRPILLASTRKQRISTNSLWISQHGTSMTTSAIAFQVVGRTETEFGQGINPHSFRHLAATTIATANPEGVSDIQLVLGHTSSRTGEKHYNLAKMVDASRAYQATLALYGDAT